VSARYMMSVENGDRSVAGLDRRRGTLTGNVVKIRPGRDGVRWAVGEWGGQELRAAPALPTTRRCTRCRALKPGVFDHTNRQA